MGRAASLEELFMASSARRCARARRATAAVALRDPEDEDRRTLYVIDERANEAEARAVSARTQGLIGWAMPQRRGARHRATRASDPRARSARSTSVVGATCDDGARRAARGRGRRAHRRDRALQQASTRRGVHRGRSRAPPAHRGERVDRDPAPAVARGARARGAPDDDRAPALRRHPRPEDAAHRHQRLRAADASRERSRGARRVRRAHR